MIRTLQYWLLQWSHLYHSIALHQLSHRDVLDDDIGMLVLKVASLRYQLDKGIQS